jgi:hypothetical protein
MMLEQIYDTFKRYRRIVGARVFNVSQFSEHIACRFTRARHEELTLCWRVGITRPIIEDFVSNWNKLSICI